MSDMLVKLYNLSDYQVSSGSGIKDRELTIRRALTPEKHIIVQWVMKYFSAYWASECEAAFCRHPVSCFIAARKGDMAGFCCYDVTCKGFVGPIGVLPSERGMGIGRTLLQASLYDMLNQGYAYAIVGDAGPEEFFTSSSGAFIIEDSKPGIYREMLRENKSN